MLLRPNYSVLAPLPSHLHYCQHSQRTKGILSLPSSFLLRARVFVSTPQSPMATPKGCRCHPFQKSHPPPQATSTSSREQYHKELIVKIYLNCFSNIWSPSFGTQVLDIASILSSTLRVITRFPSSTKSPFISNDFYFTRFFPLVTLSTRALDGMAPRSYFL